MADEKKEIQIDPVILSPEVVDNFQKNYDNPSEALARDLVATMQQDYAEQMQEDPNFLTYEGLISGTAPFLEFLPSTRGKKPIDRVQTPDQVVVMFSNAEPASFGRPFLSELVKSVPATEAMAATARLTGPRIIPATTAFGASVAGPPGAVVGGVVGTVGTGALSLLAAGGAYLFADKVEEEILGPDPVITPGQRAEYEAYRTLGGGAGAIRMPWLMKPDSNLAGSNMIQNIADEAANARATAFASRLDNLISSTGKAARRNPVLTGVGETVATGGAGVGAYYAEETDPGAVGTRLIGELIGANSLYATFAKALPRFIGSTVTEDVGGQIIDSKQRKLFNNINKLYADYGTPEQYDQLIENLTSPEIQRQLQEAFPDVQFTAAQQGGDPLLMGVEAVKAKGESQLDAARQRASNQAYKFMNDFITGLISNGDPQSIRAAADLRASVFEDTLRQGLNQKMATFLQAADKLATQPGQTGQRSQQELSEQIYKLVDDYITAAGNKERELWSQTGNIDVVQPLGPDAAPEDLPAFLRAFDEVAFEDPAVQDAFAKRSDVLFKFIDNARRDLGLNPRPVLSEAEIDTLGRYRSSLDNSLIKLSGFEQSEASYANIMSQADALPMAERAAFLRQQQATLRAQLKNAKDMNYTLAEPDGQRRLITALDKAAELSSAQAAAETRAAQRAGEATDDVVPLTATRLAEVRSQLLREARSLAADPATSDMARRIGIVAEAISDDLDVDGFGEAYDIARAYTRAKHDYFTRTVVGDVGRLQRSGARRLPPEVTFETFIKSNPSMTLSRVRQLQGMAEFADEQGLPRFLDEGVTAGAEPVLTTTSNLIDSYLRGLKQVASKEVFDPNTNTTRTVINANALEQWKRDNAEVLQAFPQLQIDLADASTAQRAVEAMEKSVERARKTARAQTYLSKLIDGVSPTVAVTNAFDSENPERAFRNLFALRRMGADRIDTRQAARTGQLSALRRARANEIREAGLSTEDINTAMQSAILDHAYRAAGGEGSFNPQVFYQTLFGQLPKGERNRSLMDIADQFDIFPETMRNRIKFMSQQLMRVQAADAAGRLTDPDAFAAEAGPIVEFYIGVLGSAAGTGTFKAVGGTGPGSISAAGVGARELRKYMLELPAVSRLRALDLMFTDPQLIAALMQRPGEGGAKGRQYAKILGILNDKLFNTTASMAPYVTRETFENESRGTDEERRQRFIEQQQQIQQQQNLPPANQQGALVPPAQLPTQGSGAAPSPTQFASATPQSPPSTPTGTVDRARFAALFPEDRDLMGIASLAGQG